MIIRPNRKDLLRFFGMAMLATAVLVISGCGDIYGRDEFRTLAMNKSEVELVSAIGKPDWIDDSEPKTWIYRSITYDVANKRDAQVVVTFGRTSPNENLKVVEVRFD